MITKLTATQEAKFPEYVRKWTEIGLSTEPLNRDAIREALTVAFNQVQKKSPKLVVCTSPLATCLTRSVLASILASVSASVRD